MVRQKKGKQIMLFLFLGILIAVPFLIRNVLISGYLVYPYASLDLFSVDWKMAASVAADDSREIMAWGRGMTERAEYDAPAAVWLPKWYGALEGQFQILLIGNVVCLFAVLGYGLWFFCRNPSSSPVRSSMLSSRAAPGIPGKYQYPTLSPSFGTKTSIKCCLSVCCFGIWIVVFLQEQDKGVWLGDTYGCGSGTVGKYQYPTLSPSFGTKTSIPSQL